MKTLLVPTDFSTHSENALRAAASIAKKQEAELLIVHMAGIKDSILTKEESSNALESIFYMKLTEKRFAEYLDKPYLEGIPVREVIKKYKNFSELNDVVAENNVDLVIMSSHGSSGIEEMLVGSNTEKVVRSAKIPVLIIKQFTSDFKMETGVYVSNFSEETMEAYDKAKTFFESFGAKMKLLYVNTPGPSFKRTSEIDKLLYEFFEAANEPKLAEKIKEVTVVSDYTVEDGVFAYSQLINADLITIPTHGRQGIAHFFRGSISEDVANHATVPVLTIRM